MNPVDLIIVIFVVTIVTLIIYTRFIQNKGKSECSYCSGSSKESNLLKDYYKSKCRGIK